MLPFDIARCAGSGNDIEGWQKECEDCARRLSKSTSEYQVHMTPPEIPPVIMAFKCPYHIKYNT